MKKYLIVAILISIAVGCNNPFVKNDINVIKVNGKAISDKYQLSIYETKPIRSFSITTGDKIYLKLILQNGNIQEVIFDSNKVKIVDDGITANPYSTIVWKNTITNNYSTIEEAFSNATEVYINIFNHTTSPLIMED